MHEKDAKSPQSMAPVEFASAAQQQTASVMGRLTFGDVYLELPIDESRKSNRKLLGVLGRELKDVKTDKALFSFQELAAQLGYGSRQDVQNFHKAFRTAQLNLEQFVTRKAVKHDQLFPLIEAAILEAPLLSVSQHYQQFCHAHPNESISEQTFRKYANEIAVVKLLTRVRQLLEGGRAGVNASRYLQEVLEIEKLSGAKKREIVETFPECEPSSSSPAAPSKVWDTMGGKLLVVLLYPCNVSQEMLSLLCGVGKTSIHTWIYSLGDEELDWRILCEIVRWSGKVSFDEKWVKINGEWWFVLCAVDAVTGFPLLMAVYPTLDAVAWTVFFQRFKALYGRPQLIYSDGSKALALARERVFSGVRYQLCKFHKLRNLMKRLRANLTDGTEFRRCVRLAKHMFANAFVSSRKAAAKRLQNIAGADLADYIDEHILTPWRHLTLSLTNNAAERFNRQIEQCFSGRYGIPSEESAKVLLRGLWLKEWLLNGEKPLQETAEFRTLDMPKICQETLDSGNILHFFHEGCPELLEKLG